MSFFNLIRHYRAHRVTASIGWQSLLSFSRVLFAVLSAVLLTRYFGPEDYGFYSFILALTGILFTLTRAGTDSVTIRLLTREPENKAEVYTAAILWRSGCWFLGLIVLLAAVLASSDPRYFYALLIYIFMLFSLADVLDSFFQSQYHSQYYIITRVFVEALAFAAKVYFVFFNYDLRFFVYVIAAQYAVYALLLVGVYVMKYAEVPKFRFSKIYLRLIVKDSLPLIFAMFMVAFYMQVDQIMLSYIAGDRALGYYAPSSQICVALLAMAIIFVHPLQVRFAEFDHKSILYNQWLEYYINVITKLAIGMALLVTVTAPLIIPFLFGERFTPTTSILMVQIWSCIFSYQGAVRYREVINNYKSSYNLFGVACGAFCNVALNLVLIPEYQGIGASVATILSLFVANYVTSWVIPELRFFAKMQTSALFLKKARLPKNTEIS